MIFTSTRNDLNIAALLYVYKGNLQLTEAFLIIQTCLFITKLQLTVVPVCVINVNFPFQKV